MAMTDRTGMFSRLATCAGSGLRAAGICLLGVAASISIHASVPALAAPAQRAAKLAVPPAPRSGDCIRSVRATPAAPFPTGASAPLRPRVSAPSLSVAPRLSRRIFIEDTVPPSREALQTARVQAPIERFVPRRPATAATRNPFPAGSNRQRAP